MGSRVEGDFTWVGAHNFLRPPQLPASTVTNADIVAGADIEASKVQQQIPLCLSLPVGSDNTALRRVVHVARGAGEILSFKAGNRAAAAGADLTTVNLRINGTSALSAVVNLNLAAGTTTQTGTLTTDTYVAGDVIEIEFALTGTTVGQGGWAQAVLREDAD
jgi:hypothetical protein